MENWMTQALALFVIIAIITAIFILPGLKKRQPPRQTAADYLNNGYYFVVSRENRQLVLMSIPANMVDCNLSIIYLLEKNPQKIFWTINPPLQAPQLAKGCVFEKKGEKIFPLKNISSQLN